jgi:hypothetical protein
MLINVSLRSLSLTIPSSSPAKNLLSSELILPELEVRVDHPVGEALTANTDSFKYTVASQLVHDKMGINHACETETRSVQGLWCTFLQETNRAASTRWG